jgi:hypothetical protein
MDGADKMAFYTFGVARMSIDYNGYVGIGTASPGYVLDVNGTGRFNTGTSNVLIGGGQGAGQGGLYILPTSSIAGSSWKIGCGLQGSYSNAISFDSGVNVGIGVTNPITALDVAGGTISGGAGNTTWRIQPQYVGSSPFPSQVRIANGWDPVAGTGQANYAGVGINLNSSQGGSGLEFYTSTTNNAVPSRRVTIDGSGNVGIGTVSPTAILHVTGPASSAVSNIVIETGTDAIGQRSEVRFGIPSFAGTAYRAGITSNTYSTNGNDIQLWTNASSGSGSVPRMTILPSGLVGIGTNNPSYNLHVVGSTNVGSTFKYITYAGVPNWTSITGSFTIACGIYAATPIGTGDAFVLFSDERIKVEEQPTKSYLEVVNSVDVKTFSYIDKVQYGPQKRVGFFAQEVEKILPDAVARVKDFIPNIFAKCQAEGNCVTVVNHGLAEGTKVRVFSGQDKIESNVHVIDVNTIELEKILEKEVFVFGTEVDDFRVLNYDYMSSVAFGGLKELSALVKTQAQTIETLSERLATLEAKLAA